MKLVEKIKLLRNINNYTQVEFARYLNCGLTTITNYEGKHRNPNAEFLQKICNKFPEYTLWLMTGEVDIKQIKPKKH